MLSPSTTTYPSSHAPSGVITAPRSANASPAAAAAVIPRCPAPTRNLPADRSPAAAAVLGCGGDTASVTPRRYARANTPDPEPSRRSPVRPSSVPWSVLIGSFLSSNAG